ncbi:MAG: 4'-phosphopantetheinyl transferase superfamily protein [Clostridiales bacterium]|nr:4'-phosphopantetheinyl transferase superfamily protein [Clostridiales bacterium]
MILFWHELKPGETSRGLLDRALLAYAETLGRRTPRKARRAVAEGSHGKPYLPAMPHVFFSVSHSGVLWVCLLDKAPVGVDVELGTAGTDSPNGVPTADGAESRKAPAGRPFAKLAERYFTPAEQALFAVLGAGEAAFLQIWTRKEAYIKYTGRGLSQGLRTFSAADALPASGSPEAPGVETVRFTEQLPAAEEAWQDALEASARLAEKTNRKPAVTRADLRPVTLRSLDLPVSGAYAACCGRAEEVTILPLPGESEEDRLESAKELALAFLNVKERTEAEVRKKLREKEYDSGTIDEVLDYLRGYSYVNDEDYCRRYIRWGSSRGRGPLRLEKELAEKGLPRDLIRSALAEFRSEAEAAEEAADPFFEAALAEGLRIAERAEELDQRTAAKILRRLASKGYSAGIAYQVLENLRRKG